MTPIRMIASAALLAASLGAGASATAGTVSVDARDDIFLAGLSSVPTTGTVGDITDPFGANPSPGGNGAGLLPVAISVAPGEILDITATGTVSCCYGGSPTNGPAGGGLGGTANINGYGNVAAYTGPELGLVGVFNGPSTPWSVFLIGASDTLVVPTGATKLYLGTVDAYGFSGNPGWFNDNTGAFSVSGVPEPSTWALMGLGVFGLGAMVRAARRRQVSPV